MVAVIAALRHGAVARSVAWAGLAVSLAGVGLVATGGGAAILTGSRSAAYRLGPPATYGGAAAGGVIADGRAVGGAAYEFARWSSSSAITSTEISPV
jgi:hypothetical protein